MRQFAGTAALRAAVTYRSIAKKAQNVPALATHPPPTHVTRGTYFRANDAAVSCCCATVVCVHPFGAFVTTSAVGVGVGVGNGQGLL